MSVIARLSDIGTNNFIFTNRIINYTKTEFDKKLWEFEANMENQDEEYSIKSWTDYWALFDQLTALLKKDNRQSIIAAFRDAQRYVNGMTDGWYDFKDAFEDAVNAPSG